MVINYTDEFPRLNHNNDNDILQDTRQLRSQDHAELLIFKAMSTNEQHVVKQMLNVMNLSVIGENWIIQINMIHRKKGVFPNPFEVMRVFLIIVLKHNSHN